MCIFNKSKQVVLSLDWRISPQNIHTEQHYSIAGWAVQERTTSIYQSTGIYWSTLAIFKTLEEAINALKFMKFQGK